MSPEETQTSVVNMGHEEKSVEFILELRATYENGTYDRMFNPLDNDYFELIGSVWDTEKNNEEGISWWDTRKGPKLQICDKDMIIETLGQAHYDGVPYSVCFSDEEEVINKGNWRAGGHRSLQMSVIACNSTRRSTCKTREETDAFLSRSNWTPHSLYNVVVEDAFSNE